MMPDSCGRAVKIGQGYGGWRLALGREDLEAADPEVVDTMAEDGE